VYVVLLFTSHASSGYSKEDRYMCVPKGFLLEWIHFSWYVF